MKRRSRHLAWPCAVLWLAAGHAPASAAQAPRTLSLQQALQTAQRQQPDVRQARAEARAAQARARQAKASLLPQFNGTASYQRTTANFVARPGTVPSSFVSTPRPDPSFKSYDFYNFGLSANQQIYDFGQTIGRHQAAKATARSQAELARATQLQTALEVRIAFFDVRAAQTLRSVATQTLSNQERHLEQISGFVEVGTRPPIDVAQARTDTANARVELIKAENALATAKARLNQTMGVETGTDYEVADDVLPTIAGENTALDALLAEATRSRPEIAALQQQLRAQLATLRAIRGAYAPSLNATAALTEAGTQLDELRWNWNVGANLAWPLYQGGLTQAQVAEAKATLDSLAAQIDALRQEVRLALEQARLDVAAALAAQDASAEAVDNARQRLALAEGRYQTGVGNVIELSDAQLALTSAEAQQVQADYTLMAARARLLHALGRS